MTNAALLAARLSARPLLMLPSAVEAYAHQLMALAPERGSRGLLGWLRGGRQALTERSAGPLADAPACYYPMWLESAAGAPDGEGYGWTLKNGIALVQIDGPLCETGWAYDGETYIAGYDCLSRTFAEIAADARVKAAFIKHDSPGGVAAPGLPALAAQIRTLRAEKPVWSSCSMAASADYWLACSGSRVTAPGLGYVGSIGAVLTHCDMSGMLDKDGIVMTPIQFGAKKTDGSPYKPLSAGAKADLQAEIDEVGRLFVAGVIAGRPRLTEEDVLATEAGCFLAEASDPDRSGLALGLIDAVMGEQEAFAELSALVARPTGSLTTISLPKEAVLADKTTAIASLDTRLAKLRAAFANGCARIFNLAGRPEKADLIASLKARAETIQARIETLSARKANLAATTDDGDPDDMADDEGDDPDDSMDDGEGDEDKPKPDADESAAIAASTEAKAHPTLALTAIQSGMTLAQFQAAALAAPAAPKKGALREFMANSPRLGPDGSGSAKEAGKGLMELAVADAQAKAAKVNGRQSA